MMFSCFLKPNLFNQKRSVNLTTVVQNEESLRSNRVHRVRAKIFTKNSYLNIKFNTFRRVIIYGSQ